MKSTVGGASTVPSVLASPQVSTSLSLDEMYSRFKAMPLADGDTHEEEGLGVGFTVARPIPGATGGFLAGIPERLEVNGRFLSPADSMWHHLVYDENGNITISEERIAVYQEIVHRHVAHVPASEHPTFTFMGGGPAAGKTTLKTSGRATEPGAEFVDIAADDIKMMLPEYQQMLDSGNPAVAEGAAEFTHDESSFLAYEIQRRALANGQSILLDGTAAGPPEKLLAKANEARQHGYRVVGKYVTCPTEDAVARCVERAKRENRHVPFESLLSKHASVSRVLPVAAVNGTFDEVELYDTSDGSRPPALVFRATDGNPKVHDVPLWDRFVAKADGSAAAEARAAAFEREMVESRGEVRGKTMAW